MNATVERPILRYHGGKFLLGPWIVQHLPPHRIYVEPFGGAASVLLLKPPSYAEVYNDLDAEVVNLFRVVREQGPALREKLRLTPFSRVDFLESYTASDAAIEQARRTVVRSFMGFGSNSHNKATGFRSNTNRSGTTPAQDWKNYPECLDAIIDRLQGVVIENRFANLVIEQHDTAETLHYCDPPYPAEARDTGEDYRHEMTDRDHDDLSTLLHSVSGMVVLSGYPCDLYEDLFGDWQKIQRRALADGARERTEALWFNEAAWAALRASRAQIHLEL